jgi:hypothetical protein
MFGASHATHLVFEKDRNVPEGNEFEVAKRFGGIVNGTRLAAFGTDGLAVFARMNDGNDVLVGSTLLLEENFAEAEALVIGNEIEYSFQEHRGGGERMRV